MYIYTYLYIYIHICMYVYIHICMYDIYVYLYVSIYIGDIFLASSLPLSCVRVSPRLSSVLSLSLSQNTFDALDSGLGDLIGGMMTSAKTKI